MYAVQTTPGFVIDSRPFGEADKLISIFTRDFGLVTATAQGIRFEKSKLRYHCQEYSFGTFSLVRGKEFWRLTSAQGAEGIDLPSVELFARIASLLRRLIHGEEPHPELFECLKGLAAFCTGRAMTDDETKALESLTVFRILSLLGYVGSEPALEAFARDCEISPQTVSQASALRFELNKHINKALKESHL